MPKAGKAVFNVAIDQLLTCVLRERHEFLNRIDFAAIERSGLAEMTCLIEEEEDGEIRVCRVAKTKIFFAKLRESVIQLAADVESL